MVEQPAASTPAPAPASLTRAELEHLYLWERRIIWLFAAGIVLLAAGIALRLFALELGLIEALAMAAGAGLIVAAFVLQFTGACPRCGARLALQGLALIPDRCRQCRVAFPRPPRLDEELDN
jgi:hypothetical protein